MNSFIWSLIELNVVIGLLFIAFLGIKNRISIRQRRFLLVGIPFLAIGVILIKSFGNFSEITYSLPLVQLDAVVIGGEHMGSVSAATGAFPYLLIYGIGVIVLGLLFAVKLIRLGLFFSQNQFNREGKYRIYKVMNKPSFSFFNRIQIAANLSEDEQQVVLEHEKLHVDKKHSIDTVLLELFHIAFWFNPVFFFMKREVLNLHELEVDAEMYKKHKVFYFKFLVNYTLGLNNAHYLLTNRFYNQLTIKKRIKIMKTNIRKNTWLLSIIPLIGLGAIMLQCTKSDEGEDLSEPVAEHVNTEEKIYDEVDVYPEYDGGQSEMANFIIENVKYPEAAKKDSVEGTIYVQFVVSSVGEVQKVKAVPQGDERLIAEAERVVQLMPNWVPGEVNGERVAVRFTLPIRFQLS